MEYRQKDYFPRKNCRVRVREKQGRSKTQVPVGTEGVVFWIGDDEYRPGKRLGIKDGTGGTHWVHEDFCDFSGYGLDYGRIPVEVEKFCALVEQGLLLPNTPRSSVTFKTRPANSVMPSKILPEYLQGTLYAVPHTEDCKVWNVLNHNEQTICLLPLEVVSTLF